VSVMVKERWTEDEVCALPSGEQDYFERKGGAILSSPDFEVKLAKALSAFANTGGGHLILGVENEGAFDGVDSLYRGKTSTREWLEQIISNLVDFPLDGFRVHEVERAVISSIPEKRVVIVIDVPDSERAPHQSQRDKKYYVRLGGRSEPASHRMIEDIRNRARHPNIVLRKTEVLSIGRESGQPPANSQLNLTLRWTLANKGRLKAVNCCVLTMNEGSGMFSPYDMSTAGLVLPRPVGAWRGAFWELQHPIYPEMETDFRFRFSFPANRASASEAFTIPGTDKGASWTELSWKIYADNASVKSGRMTLREMEISPEAKAKIMW